MAHAGTGGLQKHSIGSDYPFTTAGTMKHADAPVEWRVMGCRTGNLSQHFRTYKEAQMHIASLRLRDMMHS
jgi:expansin (peptidoglycan-binding protein)